MIPTIETFSFAEFEAKTIELVGAGYSCAKDDMCECWLKSPCGEIVIIKLIQEAL